MDKAEFCVFALKCFIHFRAFFTHAALYLYLSAIIYALSPGVFSGGFLFCMAAG